VSLVHCFQHGVLSSLQNITVLSAEGHLISAGFKILHECWVQLCYLKPLLSDRELKLSSWNCECPVC
jgi:hypothetical protein